MFRAAERGPDEPTQKKNTKNVLDRGGLLVKPLFSTRRVLRLRCALGVCPRSHIGEAEARPSAEPGREDLESDTTTTTTNTTAPPKKNRKRTIATYSEPPKNKGSGNGGVMHASCAGSVARESITRSKEPTCAT